MDALKSNGTFADNYEIICPIGSGGYSTVFKARCKVTGEEVAVKRLEKNRKNHSIEEMTRRCKEEANILQEAQHPNIIEFITYYDESDYFYLITEYLPENDIFTQIRKEGKVYNEIECRRIITLLLTAVKSLHDKNIIHRDLKLENIFYYKSNTKEYFKLIDFGFATHATGMDLTDGVGTLYYAAPEVYKHEPYGKPIDLWSIGIIAYCLMYGQYPFYSKQKNLLSKLIINGKYSLPDKNKNGDIVSNEFKSFILKLLLINPLKRMTINKCFEHLWIKRLSLKSVVILIKVINKWTKIGKISKKITISNDLVTVPLENDDYSDLISMKTSQFSKSTLSVDNVMEVDEKYEEVRNPHPTPVMNEIMAIKNYSRNKSNKIMNKVSHGIGQWIQGFLQPKFNYHR